MTYIRADLCIGTLACILHIAGYGLYTKQLFSGTTRPNTAMWMLWTYLSALNACTYTSMTADVAKYAAPAATAASVFATFCCCIVSGKLQRLDFWDWPVVAMGIIAGIFWSRYQSAAGANLIVTTALALSFVPVFRNMAQTRAKNDPLPWYLWSAGYALSAVVAFTKWNGIIDLVYPATMLPLHLVVGLMSSRRKFVIA